MRLANTLNLAQKIKLWRNYHDPTLNHRFFHHDKLVSLLESCSQITSEISQVHAFVVKTGLDDDPFTVSKLLAASIRDASYAASIFKHIHNPSLFMFNTMLRAYSISADPQKAIAFFNNLRTHQRVSLDQFSFIATLKACSRVLSVESGQGIHGIVLKSGNLMFGAVKNSLLNLYGVCGEIGDARKLFDEFPQWNDLVSWNTLMSGYLRASQPGVTIGLFRHMCFSGLGVSDSTLLCLLSAFGDLGGLFGGESIHARCIMGGFCSDLNVVTALIEMYSKTGAIDSGRRIFDGIVVKDVILWNCMIDKYAKAGLLGEAVALLQLLKLERMKPNSSTLAGLLSACASSGSIKLGQSLYDYVEEERLELDAILGTALIDMFAKCGFLDRAIDVFERMESKDVKSWTAMILGYGVHGRARNAVALFGRMEEEGFTPNEVTFLAVLSACSHGGLVAEAMNLFKRMIEIYGILPKVEHHGCMIDLLGRAGLLEEAHNLIERLPIKGDATAWRALLAACRVFGCVELGECVKRVLIEIDDKHPTDSLLLSSAYAIAGMLPDHPHRGMVDEKMNRDAGNKSIGKGKTAVKEAGCSTIEMDSQWLEHDEGRGVVR